MAHSRLAIMWKIVPIAIGRKGNIQVFKNLIASGRLRAIFEERKPILTNGF